MKCEVCFRGGGEGEEDKQRLNTTISTITQDLDNNHTVLKKSTKIYTTQPESVQILAHLQYSNSTTDLKGPIELHTQITLV